MMNNGMISNNDKFLNNMTVLSLFQQHVFSTPNAIAVCDGIKQLSYAALNAAANCLAKRLLAHGVVAGDLVAFFLPRGAEQIIAILAIMKCGAAYLPLDTEHASQRLYTILADAVPKLVVTDEAGEQQLQAQSAPCLVFNTEEQNKEAFDASTHYHLSPDSLAYVIYTSGSSGVPKGVKISHRNLLSLFKGTDTLFSFSANDTWSVFHSCAFDFSVWEIWGALVHGGRMVIVPAMVARQPHDFIKLLAREKINVLNQTPSAFYGLMEEAHNEPSLFRQLVLRYVIFGGEALDISRVGKFSTQFPHHNLSYVNMYGITEITVHATYYLLTAGQPPLNKSIIGHALPHLKINLVDAKGHVITHSNEIGELCISGEGVGEGYLNQPELTKKSFLENAGNRTYCSGDLARYTEDGFLEYMGRVDQQVKIRGHRIELNEIEAALNRHPNVVQSVVICQKDKNDDPQIVAFCTLKNQTEPAASVHIKKFLRGALPPYMLPTSLHVIAAIPLTVNGKVDTNLLLTNLENDMMPSENNSSIENPLEHFVMSVWSKVLGVQNIGPEDDFFDLGGQSMNALAVIKELGITMMELFSEPTPRAIAKIILNNIQNKKETTPHQWLHSFHKSEANELSLVCVPYGGGGPFVYQDLAKQLRQHNVFAIALPGHDPLNPDAIVEFDEAVRQSVKAIQQEISGPVAIYGHCAGNALAIEIARQLEAVQVPLVAVHLGAMLLNKNPEQVIARVQTNTPEEDINFLRSIGGLDGALPDNALEDLIKVFKSDSLQAALYFLKQAKSTLKINAPLHVIVGDVDPMTKGYQIHYLDWAKFSNHLTLSVVENGGHYFVKYQTERLAQCIQQFKASCLHVAVDA